MLLGVVQELLACLHNHSLSPPADFTIIPAWSTWESLNNVLSEPIASSMFLSSTLNVAESTVVVDPVIVKSPLILTSPVTSKVVDGLELNIPTLSSVDLIVIASLLPKLVVILII